MNKIIELKDKYITIVYETNKVKFGKLTETSKEDLEDCNGMCVLERENRKIIVGIFDGTLETLHHELFHCVDFINQLIFEFKSSMFSESNAYLSTYLFREFRKGLK